MSQDTERLSGGHMTLVLELNRLAHQMRSAQVGYVPSWILACESASATITALDAEVQASRKLVADLRALHQPEWASEDAKAAGKDPWVCGLCGVADGHWPCDSARMLDEAGL